MASVSALRDVIKEMHTLLSKKSEDHPLCPLMMQLLDKHEDGEYKINDEKLLRQLQRNVVPFSSAFQSKNVAELVEEFPELQLEKLSDILSEEEGCEVLTCVSEKIAKFSKSLLKFSKSDSNI